ncbi:MAG: cytochrome c3 family protein [Candidatus Zixiibacteriota bacterium]
MKHWKITIVSAALMLSFAWLAWGYAPAKLTVPPSDIKFAHANHTDLECVDCHIAAKTSTSAGDKLFPSMETCGDCHDIEDVDNCGTCHHNTDDPQASPNPERPIEFSHKKHFEQKVKCARCHDDIADSKESSVTHMPNMPLCMKCHDGNRADNDCAVCHGQKITLLDIHPQDWRHQHAEKAAGSQEYCAGCHSNESFCIDCHRGDNLRGNIHDLNYEYTHGLDAGGKEKDCARCHDRKEFCNACHERQNRIPLEHSTLNWLADHGQAARRDVENCASCHDSSDPTCARGGCHRDADGIKGTDPRIHQIGMAFLQSKGPWHGDDNYFCFQCHTSTRNTSGGFCTYCHEHEE